MLALIKTAKIFFFNILRAMPTCHLEPRPASLRYFFRSLERSHLSQTVEALKLFLVFQFRKRCAQISLNAQKRRGLLLMMMTFLSLLALTDDLHRARPSNFYPPAGFYPLGAEDSFWIANEDIFFSRFRFRRVHFMQLIQAMKLDGIVFQCGTFKKKHRYRADVCILWLFSVYHIHADLVIWCLNLKFHLIDSAKFD